MVMMMMMMMMMMMVMNMKMPHRTVINLRVTLLEVTE
jgi:hypothetical protein